jgi:signal transduction histidine kinase
MEDFELLIEEKKAIIKCDQLPVIKGIPIQINQLFANLMSNALKFADKDRHPMVSITSSVAPKDEVEAHSELDDERHYYKISFRDNGIGFNQKNARQIFDIFQRLHGKTEYEGTGIGLAMCKKIAQNHNGAIVAESEEHKGSVFYVFLPL